MSRDRGETRRRAGGGPIIIITARAYVYRRFPPSPQPNRSKRAFE